MAGASSYYQENPNLSRSYITDDSVWEDGADSEKRFGNLVRLNECLIDGYKNFLNKDIPSLIRSYEDALKAIPTTNSYTDIENFAIIKCNLGIAYYFNNEIEKAVMHNRDAYDKVVSRIQNQTEPIQSLYIKILCNMIVFKMVKKEDGDCKAIAIELVNFLNNIQDVRKKKLFIKEAIYILFRLESLSSITQDYIDKTSSKIPHDNLGCYYMMIAIYFRVKGDVSSCLQYVAGAYQKFTSPTEDLLFMLLTSKLYLEIAEAHSVQETEQLRTFRKIYNNLLKSPSLSVLRLDTVFQNFHKRIELASTVGSV